MHKAREPGRNNACDGSLNKLAGLWFIPHLRAWRRLRRLPSSKAQSKPEPTKSEKVPEYANKFRLFANFVQLQVASEMEPAPLCADVRLFGCQLHNTAALFLDPTRSAEAGFDL
jgi:hypothetical protein